MTGCKCRYRKATVSRTDAFFAVLALLAVGCFAALIWMQVTEWQYYEDPAIFCNVWPEIPVVGAPK